MRPPGKAAATRAKGRRKAGPTQHRTSVGDGLRWPGEFGLAGDLLGLELAIEGFEDPSLEDFAVPGLYFAEDETQAGWPGVEDYRFGLEGFSGFANF